MTTKAGHSAGTPERILVAGHPFRGYIRSIATAFDSLGLEADILEWPGAEKNPLEYIKRVTWPSYLERHEQNARTAALETRISRETPDYLLMMNGVKISEKTIQRCKREGTKLALWAYDSPVRLPWVADSADSFDLIYTYEPMDIKSFPAFNRATYLPLAYDPRFYHPLSENPMVHTDVCFVGAINRSWPERTDILKRLADRLAKKRIEIWSDTIPLYSPSRLLDLLIVGGRRDVRVRRREANHDEINELYNRSRICLNIHHSQSRRAVNPRTFEIMGSGGFLLTDRSLEDIPGFEAGRDYVQYSGFDDLLAKIDHFLGQEDERLRIAKHGHSVASEAHTYIARARRILDDLRGIR